MVFVERLGKKKGKQFAKSEAVKTRRQSDAFQDTHSMRRSFVQLGIGVDT